MPMYFNFNNEKEEPEKDKDFPFDIVLQTNDFTIPIKASTDSFQKIIRYAQKLRLERGILSQDELTDKHLQVDKAIKAFEAMKMQVDKQVVKNQVWLLHQAEMVKLMVDVSYLVMLEDFFIYDEIKTSLDLSNGDINRIPVSKKYWDELKNPQFEEKDNFSSTYPDLAKVVDFGQYRKNIEKRPLEIVVGIIHTLRDKELENLSSTKNYLKLAYDNKELSYQEYTDAIKASENINFGFQLNQHVGVLIQKFAEWRNGGSNSLDSGFRK